MIKKKQKKIKTMKIIKTKTFKKNNFKQQICNQ